MLYIPAIQNKEQLELFELQPCLFNSKSINKVFIFYNNNA
jgi:hypothetical protein